MRCALSLLLLLACQAEDTSTPSPEPMETPAGEDPLEPTPTPQSHPCLVAPFNGRIGEGLQTYTAVPDGGDVFLVRGVQGPSVWHIDFAIEADNVPETVMLSTTLFGVDGGVIGPEVQIAALLVPAGGPGADWECSGTQAGLRVILDTDRYGLGDLERPWEVLCGVEAEVELVVYDLSNGREDLVEVGRMRKPIRIQPSPCDCAACGTETPACPLLGGPDPWCPAESSLIMTCDQPGSYACPN